MFIVLDLETTGLSPQEDSIIEVALIKFDRKTFQEIDRLSTFIHPGREIPALISQITNIFDEDVSNAPRFDEMQSKIQDFLGDIPIIGHNIQFDIRFLESHGIDVSKNPEIDTFFFANFLLHDVRSLNLGFLCEHFNIPLKNAHRAIDDTLGTLKLFKALMGELKKVSGSRRKLLQYFLNICKSEGVCIVLHEYLFDKNEDISKDKFIELYIAEVQKNIQDKQDILHSGLVKNIDSFLGNLDGFELRENQKTMLDKVDTALSEGSKLVIEAPTGVGKTYAYLLPAIKYSLRFGEPVHISTSTKALQDQIFFKDLDFLQKHLPNTFSFTKLKGKRNYLSLSAFLEFLDDTSKVSVGEVSFILKIVFWSIQSHFGELDELDFYGEEYSYVNEIHAGSSFTLSDSNPYKEIEFVQKARKRAKTANIIITNNHILFQDTLSQGALLGGVKNLILDEAHSLEDIITQALREHTSFQQCKNLFERLEKKLNKYETEKIDITHKKTSILFNIGEIFGVLESLIFEKFSLDTKYKNMLLGEDFFSQNKETQVLVYAVINDLGDVLEEVENKSESLSLRISQEIQEIQDTIGHLKRVFIQKDISKDIFYITHDETRGTQLFTTVLHPGEFLRSQLWLSLESVVLTSATLQMQDNFEYIQNVLHLDNFETLQLESDFDYESQSLLYIPNDLGSIKNNLESVVGFLRKFFLLVEGRTLVLLTAFSVIREIFSTLKIELEEQKVFLLAQSISGSKYKQIDFFKKNAQNSIMLGTDTFWEGVDIPGKDLQYLIIHKIPFSVPSDPVFQARSKLFKDSFQEYAIPKSILKLKQGFGRLIRTKKDTGIVVFLDDRIYSSSWGTRFLHAFPKSIKIRYGSTQKLLDVLQRNE